ncbi:MAG: 3-isopropylmalate/(R)-2-methylmalate dehydratase small subunit, partial [Candidatus Endobugula sp.]
QVTVDLESQEIVFDGKAATFDVNSYKKVCLLNGYDDIEFLVSIKDEITAFEATAITI